MLTNTEISSFQETLDGLVYIINTDVLMKRKSKEKARERIGELYMHLQRIEEVYDLQADEVFQKQITEIRTA